jgi:ferredoxin
MPADDPPRDPMPTDDLFAQAGFAVEADLFAEARRQLSVCNACRYCAGYCPVWPELELRTDLTDGDLGYLASLCHDCQDCYTACMYTAPHEFALNPPQVFAGLRADTYRRYAWPGRLPVWLTGWRGPFAVLIVAAALLIAVSAAATGRLLSATANHPGGPYEVVPYACCWCWPGRRPGGAWRSWRWAPSVTSTARSPTSLGPGHGRRPWSRRRGSGTCEAGRRAAITPATRRAPPDDGFTRSWSTASACASPPPCRRQSSRTCSGSARRTRTGRCLWSPAPSAAPRASGIRSGPAPSRRPPQPRRFSRSPGGGGAPPAPDR